MISFIVAQDISTGCSKLYFLVFLKVSSDYSLVRIQGENNYKEALQEHGIGGIAISGSLSQMCLKYNKQALSLLIY